MYETYYLEAWYISSHSCPMNRDEGYLLSIFNTLIHASSLTLLVLLLFKIFFMIF